MLRSVTSRELAEWRAYELLNGPLGPQYERDALAALHEMMQVVARNIAATSTDDSSKIPDFVPYPRAGVWRVVEEDDDSTLLDREMAEAELVRSQMQMIADELEKRE